jgi:hypothetical protein
MFDQNTQDNSQSFAQNDPVISNHSDSVTPIFPDPPAPSAPLVSTDNSVRNPIPSLDTSFESVAESIPTQPVASDLSSIISTPTPLDLNPDLLSIKNDALQQLSPLINHLDQDPADKFRTMLMMIQASDNKSLLNAAYETAKKITDEKLRAQALLDIVNEINYFTQAEKAE